MLAESEIRQKLVDVLQDKLAVEEFADWLARARRNAHRDSAPIAQQLAADLSSLMYQHEEGYLSEAALEVELEKFAGMVSVDWKVVEPRSVFGDLSSDAQGDRCVK